MIDDIHAHLNPIVTKLELLTNLSPIVETDKAYARTLATLQGIMSDYVHQLRTELDSIREASREE